MNQDPSPSKLLPPRQEAPPLSLIFLLTALAAIGPFSIDTYLPAFPEIAKSYSVGIPDLQPTMYAYLASFGLMTLWHGTLSESFGRRSVILAGLVVYTITSIGCALAPNIETLWVMRGLQGLSAGAGMVVSRAMVRDLYHGPTAQRLIAHIAIMFAVAPAIAPVIGGWLLELMHWRSIFIFLTFMGIALFIACWRYLPESLPPEKRQPLALKPLLSGYKAILGYPVFLLVGLGLGVFFGGNFIYILSAPVFLREHLGLGPTEFYWLFVPIMCGMICGSWLCGAVAGRWNDKRTLMVAFGIMGLAASLNLIVSEWPPQLVLPAMLPIALYNLGVALAMPVATLIALDMFPENRRGMAASCQSFLQTLVSAAISAFLVPLIWHSRLALALGMAALCALGALMIWGHFRLRKKAPK